MVKLVKQGLLAGSVRQRSRRYAVFHTVNCLGWLTMAGWGKGFIGSVGYFRFIVDIPFRVISIFLRSISKPSKGDIDGFDF